MSKTREARKAAERRRLARRRAEAREEAAPRGGQVARHYIGCGGRPRPALVPTFDTSGDRITVCTGCGRESPGWVEGVPGAEEGPPRRVMPCIDCGYAFPVSSAAPRTPLCPPCAQRRDAARAERRRAREDRRDRP